MFTPGKALALTNAKGVWFEDGEACAGQQADVQQIDEGRGD